VKEQKSFVNSVKETGMKWIGLGRIGSLRGKSGAGADGSVKGKAGMSDKTLKRQSTTMNREAGAGVKLAKEPTGSWFTSVLDELSG